MGRKKKQIPKYGTVTLNGIEYFRTRIEDADGKRVALMPKPPRNSTRRLRRQSVRSKKLPSAEQPPRLLNIVSVGC